MVKDIVTTMVKAFRRTKCKFWSLCVSGKNPLMIL